MAHIRDPRCGKEWSGLRREHCPACHETFSSTRAGDMHRKGEHGVNRHCADPAAVKGLVAVQHEWGTCWSRAGSYEGPRG